MLLGLGLVIVGIGLVLMLLGRTNLPIGRLPGDILYRGKHTTFYFPLATSIVLSIVLSVVLYLVSRMGAGKTSVANNLENSLRISGTFGCGFLALKSADFAAAFAAALPTQAHRRLEWTTPTLVAPNY